MVRFSSVATRSLAAGLARHFEDVEAILVAADVSQEEAAHYANVHDVALMSRSKRSTISRACIYFFTGPAIEHTLTAVKSSPAHWLLLCPPSRFQDNSVSPRGSRR